MDFLMKLFLSYAATSMVAGFFLMMLTVGDIIPFRAVPPGIILFLWIGPLMLALAAGLPFGLFMLWKKR